MIGGSDGRPLWSCRFHHRHRQSRDSSMSWRSSRQCHVPTKNARTFVSDRLFVSAIDTPLGLSAALTVFRQPDATRARPSSNTLKMRERISSCRTPELSHECRRSGANSSQTPSAALIGSSDLVRRRFRHFNSNVDAKLVTKSPVARSRKT